MSTGLEWLRHLIIVGHEDDDPYERDDQGEIVVEDDEQVLKEGWELDANGKPKRIDDGGDDGEEETPEQLREALEKTKRALREERMSRRKAERDAKKKTRKATADKDEKDLEETRDALTKTASKVEKLATRLLTQSKEAAVLEEARRQGFIDPTDALTREVLDDIDADQDDDDPSDIVVDDDSVRDAVKALADKKKHLLGQPGGGGQNGTQSGTRMGKKKANDNEKLDDEKLKELYPGLR